MPALAWVRFSYRTEQSDPARGRYRSMLQLWAYQCGLGRHALIQYAEYSGTHGAGQVVASDARSRLCLELPGAGHDRRSGIETRLQPRTNERGSNRHGRSALTWIRPPGASGGDAAGVTSRA